MNRRELDEDINLSPRGQLTYADYLHLSALLAAQRPLTRPEHHDELLFIVGHQVAELWMKLIIHELKLACQKIAADSLRKTFKTLSRVKQIQEQMISQWAVLETLTPYDYAQFRDVLESASGFQSAQYREMEFLLNCKDPALLQLFDHDSATKRRLEAVLRAPSLYDEFLCHLARQGYDVPMHCTHRDWAEPYEPDPQVVEVFQHIYERADQCFEEYEMCEKLVDIEGNLQRWRFRHVKTVERIIGLQPGTGGSSGVAFLKRALDLRAFPELIDVRTKIGSSAHRQD